MLKTIFDELKNHAPFTSLGALSGIVILFIFAKTPADTSHSLFYIFHPAHVFFSAIVTASIYRIYHNKNTAQKCNFLILLMIGYLGSVGVGTLSDSLIPFLGEKILGMSHAEVHIGFIEKWWIVNPLAVLGVCIAYVWPTTKFPHTIHVLLSTWASLFHMMMARSDAIDWFLYPAIFIFLFIAVWAPCCLSDIVFPLLFIKGNDREREKLTACSHRKKKCF